MVLRIDPPPLQSLKKCGALGSGETHAAVHDRRPPEIRARQRFPHHHQSGLIPGDDLDPVSTARFIIQLLATGLGVVASFRIDIAHKILDGGR
jgi:hypothetical protein